MILRAIRTIAKRNEKCVNRQHVAQAAIDGLEHILGIDRSTADECNLTEQAHIALLRCKLLTQSLGVVLELMRRWHWRCGAHERCPTMLRTLRPFFFPTYGGNT